MYTILITVSGGS